MNNIHVEEDDEDEHDEEDDEDEDKDDKKSKLHKKKKRDVERHDSKVKNFKSSCVVALNIYIYIF